MTDARWKNFFATMTCRRAFIPRRWIIAKPMTSISCAARRNISEPTTSRRSSSLDMTGATLFSLSHVSKTFANGTQALAAD